MYTHGSQELSIFFASLFPNLNQVWLEATWSASVKAVLKSKPASLTVEHKK